ncbi:uncharacterized protein BCR38DRAFT_414539 [Pseudomassariella vexata]|uniref:BTB domain-containing protein n=1 Tax=Pseudomassariella vexata TaxID=1141098 RepID=A0A1Y2DB11_9PEZI|nr:uncharacterized protein BCR38DRAFT_414539 [Pseudomassariella vexata]ORY56387.1 hypothetical protein BCR38DRAFT_414539 [Pseudomassariella vexata]
MAPRQPPRKKIKLECEEEESNYEALVKRTMLETKLALIAEKGELNTAGHDRELLDTGAFSDITVRTGAVMGFKNWKLHKDILSARSQFFKEALAKNWPVDWFGRIDLTRYTDYEARTVLLWIYTRTLVSFGLEIEQRIIGTLVDCYQLSDDFGMPDMGLACTARARAWFKPHAKAVQKAFCCAENKSSFLSPDVLAPIKAAIDEIYRSKHDTVHDVAASFVAATHGWILSDVAFQQVYYGVPKFPADILRKVTSLASTASYVPYVDLHNCSNCGQEPAWDKEGYYASVCSAGRERATAMCNKCSRGPELLLEKDFIHGEG